MVSGEWPVEVPLKPELEPGKVQRRGDRDASLVAESTAAAEPLHPSFLAQQRLFACGRPAWRPSSPPSPPGFESSGPGLS